MDIIALIQAYQLDIMLIMAAICGTLTILASFTGALSDRRRRILFILELTATLLLICDRFAYLYRGDASTTGYWMVRISNFMVYLCSLAMPLVLTLYLRDLYRNEGGLTSTPKRLHLCITIAAVGVLLLIISQFTGLYYTFDEQNRYQRAPGNIISFAAPLLIMILQLSVMMKYRKRINGMMANAIALNLIVPVVASVIQLFTYGISLTNMSSVGMAILLYIIALIDLGKSLEQARISEIETLKEAHQREQALFKESHLREHTLFEQTVGALVSAIDAKDEYTRGHSARVAMYSELIAQDIGMSDEECEQVYFAALLHDVGKIGISDTIINKAGRLTDEEFAQIKLHPVYGNQILSGIYESPYLSIGAHYHHERYDGRGYPEGLAGEDIPQIARIIGVADAYDAMTSKRSYRDLRPQHLVREELIKGMETQFDPQYARVMLHYMDLDREYQMHEQLEDMHADFVDGLNVDLETSVRCDGIYHDCSTGVRIIDRATHIQFVCTPHEGYDAHEALPSMILFDSLDSMVHEQGALQKDRRYFEYAQIRFDGRTICKEARKVETQVRDAGDVTVGLPEPQPTGPVRYDIEAARVYDHMLIRISNGRQTVETIVALPFSGRFSYLSLTGEHCTLSDIRHAHGQHTIKEGTIPRIAEELSYTRGCPEGDIPNIQIEGSRARMTQGIKLAGTTRISFHAQSLPNARLIWHCPYIYLFTARDGKIDGDGFQEIVQIRLDGEELEDNILTENNDVVRWTQDFEGWNAWVKTLHEGFDCTVTIRIEGNTVTVTTENLGIAIQSVKTIPATAQGVYAALTGDQCAITDIHIQYES